MRAAKNGRTAAPLAALCALCGARTLGAAAALTSAAVTQCMQVVAGLQHAHGSIDVVVWPHACFHSLRLSADPVALPADSSATLSAIFFCFISSLESTGGATECKEQDSVTRGGHVQNKESKYRVPGPFPGINQASPLVFFLPPSLCLCLSLGRIRKILSITAMISLVRPPKGLVSLQEETRRASWSLISPKQLRSSPQKEKKWHSPVLLQYVRT